MARASTQLNLQPQTYEVFKNLIGLASPDRMSSSLLGLILVHLVINEEPQRSIQ
jgi:hypothetical protein